MTVVAKRRLVLVVFLGVLLSLTLALIEPRQRQSGSGVEVVAATRRSFRIAVDSVGVLDVLAEGVRARRLRADD